MVCECGTEMVEITTPLGSPERFCPECARRKMVERLRQAAASVEEMSSLLEAYRSLRRAGILRREVLQRIVGVLEHLEAGPPEPVPVELLGAEADSRRISQAAAILEMALWESIRQSERLAYLLMAAQEPELRRLREKLWAVRGLSRQALDRIPSCYRRRFERRPDQDEEF